jgi:NAD(P)-dependent dehydrogenase (short-subunit alcohol dehydrogenase family)
MTSTPKSSRLAVITGGSTGIGLASATRLVRDGWRVIVTGRNRATLDAAAAQLGTQAIAVQADSAELTDLPRIKGAVDQAGGAIDFLFVNAGVALFAPHEQVTPEFFDNQFNINVRGAFFTLQTLIPQVVDGGSIAVNASIVKDVAFPGSTVYSATKAAVASIAKTLAAELAPRKIRVNTISPGPISTPIYGKMGMPAEQVNGFASHMQSVLPLKRFGESDEVGELAAFLASDASRFITGVDIPIDGGFLLGKMA